ncbi:MAG: trypsin-like peptidase domain-containing protein [bacterium]
MNSRKTLTTLTCLTACILAPLSARDDGAAVFEKISPSIVAIHAFDRDNQNIGQATAFAVDSNGVLVTNAHVLGGGVLFRITLPSGRTVPVARILAIDHLHDLAFLFVPGCELPALELGDSDAIAVGERVFAIGNPRGLENTISDGVLSGIRKFSGQGAMLQTTTPVSPGSSGGVLVNVKGKVVGVTTFIVGGGQNLNFAIPSNVVSQELRKLGPLPAAAGLEEAAARRELPVLREPVHVHPTQHSLYLLMNIGYSAFNARDYEVARESFLKAFELDSTEVEAMTALAQTAYVMTDYQAALSWYQRAVALDTTDAKTYYNCGVTASRLDSVRLALRMYEKAVHLQPEYEEAWFEIGVLHGQQRAYQQAVQAFKRAQGLNPSNWRALYYLGMTADAMGDPQNGVVWLRRAAELEPGHADIWFKLGLAYYDVRKHGAADSAFAQAVTLAPQHGPAWLWRGISANRKKEADKARQYAEQARPLLTDTVDKLNLYILSADVFLQQDAPDEAVSELQQALDLSPNDLRVHELLSHAYLAQGDYKKANEEVGIIEKLKQQALK